MCSTLRTIWREYRRARKSARFDHWSHALIYAWIVQHDRRANLISDGATNL
jgi:hypothetical protein